jgi:hypothetical protein
MNRPPFRERAKRWLDLVQVALTIGAILTAGWWFYRQGKNRPCIKIEHSIAHRRLSPGRQLLVVDVKVTNVGSVPLGLGRVMTRVYEILPQGRVLEVKESRGLYLGPGEEDHRYVEFEGIPGEVSVVRVYSFLESSAVKGVGWDLATICDLDAPERHK